MFGFLKQIKLYQLATDYNPIHITGAIRHVGFWITSNYLQTEYSNPYFTPTTINGEKNECLAVYCVHGTADQPGAFYLILNRLFEEHKLELPKAIAYGKSVKFSGRWLGNDIPFFAQQLADDIKARQHKNVILIVHSRGGLVASYFAENLAKEHGINVHMIISICSPFQGSHAALFPLTWLSSSVAAMKPESEFLIKLNQQIQNSKVKYLHFAAEKDLLVSKTQALIENNELVELDKHAHLSILSSNRLVKQILKWMQELSQELNLENDSLYENNSNGGGSYSKP